jgi:hypothetical protein
MNPFKRAGERRRRKAHERYLRERDRQRALSRQDTGEASRRNSLEIAGKWLGSLFQ